MKYVNNKEILLFIDELHTIIGAGGAEGALDASNILKPSLSRGEIQLIGATTLEEYRKYIEKDAASGAAFSAGNRGRAIGRSRLWKFLRGFVHIMKSIMAWQLKRQALEAAVKMSVRYINDRFLPDKAIDIIDEARVKGQPWRLSRDAGNGCSGS